MKFTVLVCTYNASESELEKTLKSILNQTFTDYEIIICDDGSDDNHKDYIENIFRNVSFVHYTMLLSKENSGTVRNILRGLNVAKGEIVKPVGAGDYFDSNETLKTVNSVMIAKNSVCLFTDMRLFKIQNDIETDIEGFSIPFLKNDYIDTSDYTVKMQENIIVYNDQISGASMFYDRELLLKSLNSIVDEVKYMEDLVQYLILLQGKRIDYIPTKLIAYEIGTGISTLSNNLNNSRMLEDKNRFLRYVFERYSDNPYIIRRKKIENIENKYKNKMVKLVFKTMHEPKWLYLKIKKNYIRKRAMNNASN